MIISGVIGGARQAADARRRKGPRVSAGIRSFAAILLFWLTTSGFNQQQVAGAVVRKPSEFEVKAAFLLNFTKFVEWPRSTPPDGAPFEICIFGEDPYGRVLDQMVAGEQVNGRHIIVRRIHESVKSCGLLYVGRTEEEVASLLEDVAPACLTVGETSDFLKVGGMIGFALENHRVRFDVNLRAVGRSSLQISSKLLNVARTVER